MTLEKVVLEFGTDQKGLNQGLNAVLASLGKAKRGAVDASGGVGAFEKSWTRMASAVGAGALLERAATGLISMGKAAIDSAGNIVDLSDSTGLSIEAVQVYGAVAKQTGGDLNTYADAIFKLGINLAKGGTEVEGAVKRLGLNYADLRKMKPEEQFEVIAEKLKNVRNEGDRNRDGVALLGKAWKDVAPGIVAGIEDIKKATTISSDATVRAVDAATDAFDQFITNAEAKTRSLLGSIILIAKALPDWNILSGMQVGSGWGARGMGKPYYSPPKAGENKPGRTTADDARDETHAKRMADEAERYTKAIAELADELSGMKSAEDMSKLADAIVVANRAGGVMAAKIPKIIEQIKGWKEEGLRLQPILQDILDEDTRNAAQAAAEYSAFLEDVLDTARRLEEIEPPVWFTLGQNARSFGKEVPKIDLGFDPDAEEIERRKEKLQGYADLWGAVNSIVAQFGTQGSVAWGLVTAATNAGARALEQYIQKQETAATVSAAGASLATAGFAVMIQAIQQMIAADKRFAEMARQFDRRAADLGEQYGYTAEQIVALLHASEVWENRFASGMQSGLEVLEAFASELAERSRLIDDNLSDMADALERFGGSVPLALRPMVEQLLAMNGLTREQRDMLEGMAQDAPWETYAEAADRYGISLDALGGKFNQLHLNDVFDQLFVDWTMFEDIGADMADVFAHMSGQVNEALQRARRLGLAVPEYMRPMLQAMLEAGQLIDENGQVLSDLSGFKFEASIQSSLEITNDILQRILDALTGQGKKPADIAGAAGDRTGSANAFGPGADALAGQARQMALVADQRVHRAALEPAPSTASVPAVVQYSGNVSVHVAGRRVVDVLMDDLLKAFEQNDGQGRPVGPTSRLNAALGKAA